MPALAIQTSQSERRVHQQCALSFHRLQKKTKKNKNKWELHHSTSNSRTSADKIEQLNRR
jgi:hypothetical protein